MRAGWRPAWHRAEHGAVGPLPPAPRYPFTGCAGGQAPARCSARWLQRGRPCKLDCSTAPCSPGPWLQLRRVQGSRWRRPAGTRALFISHRKARRASSAHQLPCRRRAGRAGGSLWRAATAPPARARLHLAGVLRVRHRHLEQSPRPRGGGGRRPLGILPLLQAQKGGAQRGRALKTTRQVFSGLGRTDNRRTAGGRLAGMLHAAVPVAPACRLHTVCPCSLKACLSASASRPAPMRLPWRRARW